MTQTVEKSNLLTREEHELSNGHTWGPLPRFSGNCDLQGLAHVVFSSVDFRYSHSLLLMVYSVTLYVNFPSACVHERPSMKQKREVVLLEK